MNYNQDITVTCCLKQAFDRNPTKNADFDTSERKSELLPLPGDVKSLNHEPHLTEGQSQAPVTTQSLSTQISQMS